MNRRAFCRSVASTAATLASSRSGRAANAAKALPHSRDPKGQLALSSYPFRGHMDAPANNRRDPALPAMNVEQFAQFARDRFGLAAVELLDKHFQSTDAAYLQGVRKSFAKQHMALVNIAFDNKAQLCSSIPEQTSAAMALHRQWIDVAVTLDCPSVRMRIPMGSEPKVLDMACAVPALKQLATYAASRGVLLSLENDSPFTESPAQLIAVLKAVGSPALHVLPDFGNGLADGDEAKNAQDLEQLFPLAYNIAHAKDWEQIAGVRKTLELQTAVDIAVRSGFRGWYSLESDARNDVAADTERTMNKMIECLHVSSTHRSKATAR